MNHANDIPTTVVTGSLGAGKTTLILNLIKQLPPDYNAIWLKNEYGDVNIDTELAKESNIQTKEVLNGCICCVLIGKLADALEEIAAKYSPDRLIIETAGTAYPFPIVDQVNKVNGVSMDGLITVVDALNFERFNDKTKLAKDQAKYVDLVVINKVGEVEKDKLEHVLDEVYDLYLDSPKVETKDGFVSINYAIGIDTKLANQDKYLDMKQSYSEAGLDPNHLHTDNVDVFTFIFENEIIDPQKLTQLLGSLPASDYFRIKGVIKTPTGFQLLNYVLGKTKITALDGYSDNTKISVMGRGIANSKSNFHSKLANTFI